MDTRKLSNTKGTTVIRCNDAHVASVHHDSKNAPREDARNMASELVRRWNSFPALVEALSDLLGDGSDTHEVNGRYECRHCGREWSALCGDNEVPENCPSDDCPGHIARAALKAASE